MASKDGGPAMLVDVHGTSHYGHIVLNLRDYFAGQALVGELASYSTMESVTAVAEAMHKAGEKDIPNHVAKLCYRLADAMLAARDAEGGAGQAAKCRICGGSSVSPVVFDFDEGAHTACLESLQEKSST